MVPFSSGATDAPVSYQFKVTGIFRMGFNEYDTRLAYVSIADAQRLANVRRLVSGVELRFSDPMLALTMGKEVQRRLGSPHHLVDWKELNGNLFRALLIQKVFIALILVIIVVVAAFNIVCVADDDRAVEGARGRDPEIDGRVIDAWSRASS